MTKPKFKSDAFEAIHSSARAMFKVGAIDRATMRHFDARCLRTPGAMESVGWDAAKRNPSSNAECWDLHPSLPC